MFNVVEHGLTEVVRAGQRRAFVEIKLARFMQLESIVEQIFKSALRSRKFIVSIEEIIQNLVDSLFDKQGLKNLNEKSTLTVLTEL